MPADVCALVVTYEHEHEIRACVDAALAQDGAAVTVVVADNASTDGTLAALDGAPVTVLARGVNDGYAAGVNAALAAAPAGADVLLLNPDLLMDPGCVAALRAHLAARPGSGAVAALLREGDGELQRFAVRDPDLRAVLWSSTHVGRRLDARAGRRAWRRRHYEALWERGFDGPVAVDCPAAACVLVRAEAMRPMDPALPLFFNDAALWRGLRADGWSVEVAPAAGAVHEGGTSIRRTDPVRIRAEWVAATLRYVPGRRRAWALFALDAALSLLALALGRGDERTATDLRGTLGGLGLPGGPPPWLTPVRRLVPARRKRS